MRKGFAGEGETPGAVLKSQTRSFPQQSTVTLPSQRYEMILASDWERIKENIREMPEPSTHWLALSLAMLGIAAALAIAAITAPSDAAVDSGTLWGAAAALGMMAGLCAKFHWSSNSHVRHVRESIVKDMERSVVSSSRIRED